MHFPIKSKYRLAILVTIRGLRYIKSTGLMKIQTIMFYYFPLQNIKDWVASTDCYNLRNIHYLVYTSIGDQAM